MDLYIYAYPAQMINFQLIRDEKIFIDESCPFETITSATKDFLDKYDIKHLYLIGETKFTDKIESIINEAFNEIKVERIKND